MEGSPSYIASFGFDFQLSCYSSVSISNESLSPCAVVFFSYVFLYSFIFLPSFISLSSFNSPSNFISLSPPPALHPLNLQQRAHGNWLMATPQAAAVAASLKLDEICAAANELLPFFRHFLAVPAIKTAKNGSDCQANKRQNAKACGMRYVACGMRPPCVLTITARPAVRLQKPEKKGTNVAEIY